MSSTPETIYKRYDRLLDDPDVPVKAEQLPALVAAEYLAERLTIESDKIIDALRNLSSR